MIVLWGLHPSIGYLAASGAAIIVAVMTQQAFYKRSNGLLFTALIIAIICGLWRLGHHYTQICLAGITVLIAIGMPTVVAGARELWLNWKRATDPPIFVRTVAGKFALWILKDPASGSEIVKHVLLTDEYQSLPEIRTVLDKALAVGQHAIVFGMKIPNQALLSAIPAFAHAAAQGITPDIINPTDGIRMVAIELIKNRLADLEQSEAETSILASFHCVLDNLKGAPNES